MKTQVNGQLTEIGQFQNEPGHGFVVDTGEGEVFIGGLEREDIARLAKLLYQNVSVQIEVAPSCALAADEPGALRPGLERAIEILSKTDCYTAHGARDSGLAFADINTEHVKAFRDHVIDKLDAAIGASVPPDASRESEYLDALREIAGYLETKNERCQCGAQLPPLAQWSMPSCPLCVEKAEAADETSTALTTQQVKDWFADHCGELPDEAYHALANIIGDPDERRAWAARKIAPLADEDGPGEEDGPWAEGWEQRRQPDT